MIRLGGIMVVLGGLGLIGCGGGGGGGGDGDGDSAGIDAGGGGADASGELAFGTPVIDPPSAPLGDDVVLTITLPIAAPPGVQVLGASVDLTAVLPETAPFSFNDLGAGGDAQAGDGVYTAKAGGTVMAALGAHQLPIAVRVFREGGETTLAGPPLPFQVLPVAAQVALTGATITPGKLVVGGPQTVQVDVTTVVTLGSVTRVTVDLTPLGGVTPVDLTEIAPDQWRASAAVSPLAPGPAMVTLRAHKNSVEVASAQASTSVLAAPLLLLSDPQGTQQPLDQGPHAISVLVEPVGTMVGSVVVDASTIGGAAEVFMLDDGMAPDVAAGDGRYTGSFQAAYGPTPVGDHALTVSAQGASLLDGALVTASIQATVGLLAPVPAAAIGAATVTPERGPLSVPTQVTVSVSASATYGVVSAVEVDLTVLGLGPAELLHDDGLAGDLTAGDGTYTLVATTAASAPHGVQPLPITAKVTGDGGMASASTNGAFTVVRGHQLSVQVGGLVDFFGGTVLTPVTPPACETCFARYALPFAVRFFGVTHAAGQFFRVSSMALLSLDGNASTVMTPGDIDHYLLFTEDLPFLSPMHHLFGDLGAPVVVVFGAAPDRVLTVRWSGTYVGGTGSIELQARFFESGPAEFALDLGNVTSLDADWSQFAAAGSASFDEVYVAGSAPLAATLANRRTIFTW